MASVFDVDNIEQDVSGDEIIEQETTLTDQQQTASVMWFSTVCSYTHSKLYTFLYIRVSILILFSSELIALR